MRFQHEFSCRPGYNETSFLTYKSRYSKTHSTCIPNHVHFISGNKNDEYIHDRERNISFKYHNMPRNWTDAIETCRQEEGRLFVADSPEKNDLVYNLKGGFTKYCTAFRFEKYTKLQGH